AGCLTILDETYKNRPLPRFSTKPPFVFGRNGRKLLALTPSCWQPRRETLEMVVRRVSYYP
ncbi:hypothetical protein VS883_27985, partial [Escherichia coli]